VASYVQWESEIHYRVVSKNLEIQAHMKEIQAAAISVQPVSYRVTYVGESIN
jgi:hypothetical protein